MSRCVATGERGWMCFRLAMAVACPNISKPRFVENSIGSNCFLEQIKAVEAERDALLDAEQTKASAPPPMLLGVHGVGPEFASVLWSEGPSGFDNRRQVAAYAGLAPDALAKRVGQSRAGHLAIGQLRRRRTTMISGSPGFGYAISRARHSPSGSRTESIVTAVVGARRRSWRWRESCWSRSGNM